MADVTNGTVGEYDATTGATINANFIIGLVSPVGMALDGNNHLFVTNGRFAISEFDATTGVPINLTFVNGQGLDGPIGLIYVPAAVPEPGSLALIGAFAAAAAGWAVRRRRRARRP